MGEPYADVLFQAGMVGAFIVFALVWTWIWLRYQKGRDAIGQAERERRDQDWREFLVEERKTRAEMIHALSADISGSMDLVEKAIRDTGENLASLNRLVTEHDQRMMPSKVKKAAEMGGKHD